MVRALQIVPPREPGADDGPIPGFPFDAIPLDEFLAREFPPLAWLIPGLVPLRGTTLIVSAPNVGKTLLAFDYAARAAGDGRRVLVMEEEGSARGCQERLHRAADAQCLTRDQQKLIEVAHNSEFSLLDPRSRTALVEWMKMRGTEVLVLDSIAAVTRGTDENDPAGMSLVSESVHRVGASMNGSVIGLHHTTKEAWKPGNTPTLGSARGHGALVARVDTVLGLVPIDNRPGFVCFELYCLKQREAERPGPKEVQIAMTGAAAVVATFDLERAAMDGAVARVRALIPLLLRHIPAEGELGIGTIDLFRKVGKRDADARQALGMLLDEKSVMETVSGKLVKRRPEGNA